MSDAALLDQYGDVGDTYMRLARDRAAFATAVAARWRLIAEHERRIRRTPSGTLQAVTDALADEHRHTPLVPDPRKQ